ncbi:probable RNA polymerase II nuclear localization protein SLC7A6OS [Macrobrachium nipponense]|uniref:probable RNA polymerase II nuclear localization protein SLC7A6OS n=1 Tax=Macrobrachium nipponense TaxID=159736 RepID=UPI0030C89290
MATVIRIKRRLDEEPTENIIIKAKRSRNESTGDEDQSGDRVAVLTRVGTVESRDDPLESLVKTAIKKGWELRQNYKKLGSDVSYKEKSSQEAKKRAVTKRYKIISQSRGIGEPSEPDKDDVATEEKTVANKDATGAEALPVDSMELTYFDAVLANEMDDIITCNGVPMESEQHVYDVFYSTQPVNWEDVMEQNVCRIERELFESVTESESDDQYEDDDDENEEENWRNDYPDYDDSPYEDEEDYLNSQIRKTNKRYETDESYDAEDYEEEGFDSEGNLILSSQHPLSLAKLMRRVNLDSDSDD